MLEVRGWDWGRGALVEEEACCTELCLLPNSPYILYCCCGGNFQEAVCSQLSPSLLDCKIEKNSPRMTQQYFPSLTALHCHACSSRSTKGAMLLVVQWVAYVKVFVWAVPSQASNLSIELSVYRLNSALVWYISIVRARPCALKTSCSLLGIPHMVKEFPFQHSTLEDESQRR